ncbi:alkaline phosphatase family protein [Saccharothrix xinjiangensis]|uniref:Alkaline phosphatase family protein n=1 Tax=Saccharothrix xinjiangensis TaxID=204798 RepID=A0ABV9Y731_9PSEU
MSPLRHLAAAGLAIAALTTAPLPQAAAAAAAATKVLVIGIDGLVLDRIAAADAPALDSLIGTGSSSKTSLYANPMAPTLSGPGWATIATGAWPDRHGVTSNSWGTSHRLAEHPDFLTRLERADRSRTTYAIATWAPLVTTSAGTAIFGPEIDLRVPSGGDQATADQASRHIRATDADAGFLHFDDVDAAGHSCGAAGSCYRDAITDVDRRVKQVLDAIAARPTRAQEDWTVVVTSDHGHTDTGGHGGGTPGERSSLIIHTGPGVTPGRPAVAPENVDVAATALSRFGVTATGLDGRPLGTASTDPFDAVALKPAVHEATDVLGWSDTAPSGWRVDNTGMGAGGVTEWHGWAFTNDDFWTRTEAGQWRETNVRARGVFAVADSDEWSDRTRTGAFTSALVSPAYDVTGRTRATIGFVSHHRKEGAETATVSVSFDGGASRTVLTYTGDVVARVESVPVAVPAGAKRMTVTWRLANGDNNWYWAVDSPAVTS